LAGDPGIGQHPRPSFDKRPLRPGACGDFFQASDMGECQLRGQGPVVHHRTFFDLGIDRTNRASGHRRDPPARSSRRLTRRLVLVQDANVLQNPPGNGQFHSGRQGDEVLTFLGYTPKLESPSPHSGDHQKGAPSRIRRAPIGGGGWVLNPRPSGMSPTSYQTVHPRPKGEQCYRVPNARKGPPPG